MDTAVVAVMAVLMAGAAVWCWRMENRPDAEDENTQSE